MGGCSTTLPDFPRTPSHALSSSGTQLAALAAHSIDQGDESGFRLLPYGAFALDARLVLADTAQRSIDAQYYLIANDSTGHQFLRALSDAARRGVRVRLLVDDFFTSDEDSLLTDLATVPNVQVRLYNPFTAGRQALATRILFSLGDFWQLDHRMHNKLYIADGAMAISGGRNIADAYFTRAQNDDNFVDLDVLSAGPVVTRLERIFDAYWNDTYSVPIEDVMKLPQDVAAAQAQFEEKTRPQSSATPKPDEKDALGYQRLSTELKTGHLALHLAPAIVLADPPSKPDGVDDDSLQGTVTHSVEDALKQAQSEVIIASPYVVPGPSGMQSIRAARARGVHVVVITNSLAATDEPIVQVGYAHYRREMLQAGVEIFELSTTLATRRADLDDFRSVLGRLHAKTWVIDRKRVFIGSMNLDERSAHINTEMGLLIASPDLSAEVIKLLQNDLVKNSYQVRLDSSGHLEWVSHQDHQDVVLHSEPDVGLRLKLELLLLAPLAPEKLL